MRKKIQKSKKVNEDQLDQLEDILFEIKDEEKKLYKDIIPDESLFDKVYDKDKFDKTIIALKDIEETINASTQGSKEWLAAVDELTTKLKEAKDEFGELRELKSINLSQIADDDFVSLLKELGTSIDDIDGIFSKIESLDASGIKKIQKGFSSAFEKGFIDDSYFKDVIDKTNEVLALKKPIDKLNKEASVEKVEKKKDKPLQEKPAEEVKSEIAEKQAEAIQEQVKVTEQKIESEKKEENSWKNKYKKEPISCCSNCVF